jgi:hypothetical protein
LLSESNSGSSNRRSSSALTKSVSIVVMEGGAAL